MKSKVKPSRTTTPIEHKKSSSKIMTSNNNKHPIINRVAVETKKKSNRDRILSAINGKENNRKNKHNLSQSQLHNHNNFNSVMLIDEVKDLGSSTQYTKSKTKINAVSNRRSKDDT